MDIAKNVFQLHSVNTESGEIERIKLRRGEVLAFFAQRTPALVAIEACGSAHEWARQLRALGHQVRLMAPKSVRPASQTGICHPNLHAATQIKYEFHYYQPTSVDMVKLLGKSLFLYALGRYQFLHFLYANQENLYIIFISLPLICSSSK